MRKFEYLCALCGMSLLLLAGCKEKTGEVTKTVTPTVEAQEATKMEDTEEMPSVAYAPMEYSNPATGVLGFAADEAGDLYVLENDGVLTCYGATGKVKKSYSDCLDFTAFMCEDGTLYAYDAVKHQVEALDVESGAKKTITDRFYAEEVLKIGKAGDSLYILMIPEHYQSMAGENEYHDYGECLYRISLTDGKTVKLPIRGITALYVTEDESVYYYAYQEGTYVLCRYDTGTGESSVRCDMMAQAGVTYVTAFVFEQGVFSYAEPTTPCVRAVSLKDGTELKKTEEILILSGNDMDCVNGNILYYGYPVDGTPNCLNWFYVENPF